ncbi:MAG: proline racemase family protein [Bacteroidota bacterium]
MTTYSTILGNKNLRVPEGWLQIKTVDMHTGGEPLRVILDGFPELKGNTVLEYRRYCKAHHDHLRTALLFEPRGHADMYGCILVPPNDEGADFGILFLHNEGYSTMCGHAIIAISTLAVQMEWIKVREGENILKIDAPCGRIISYVNVKEDRVEGVKFYGVPSFVVGLDRTAKVPGIGTVTYDLAYGGGFYAYVDLEKNTLDVNLEVSYYQELIKMGMDIKHAVIGQDTDIVHPFEKDLGFLYGTIFIEPSQKENIHSKNVCIFADGEVDRCPTGSGVSGRMAIHWARKELARHKTIAIESITGSIFTGSVVAEVDYGPFKAVTPQVGGTAHLTGVNTFIIDPDDPMKEGFIFR